MLAGSQEDIDKWTLWLIFKRLKHRVWTITLTAELWHQFTWIMTNISVTVGRYKLTSALVPADLCQTTIHQLEMTFNTAPFYEIQ